MVIIEEGTEALVQRLGRYNTKLRPGVNFVLPFIDEIVVQETIQERIKKLDSGLVISKNGIPLQINLYLYWQMLDLALAFYAIEDYLSAIENLTKLALQSEISKFDLEEIYSSSETQKNKIEQSGSFGAGYIEQAQNNELVGTQHNYAQSKQSLAKAAKEIQDLLKQLEESNPTSTTLEQMSVATEAIKQIENNPTLKQRIINAAKNGSVEAIKQTPIVAIVAATIEGWLETDNQ